MSNLRRPRRCPRTPAPPAILTDTQVGHLRSDDELAWGRAVSIWVPTAFKNHRCIYAVRTATSVSASGRGVA